MKENMLEIGKIVNTHGIRGEIKIQPWCDDPELFFDLDGFYVGDCYYRIQKARIHKNCIIVAVEGVNSINDAELLKNQVITAERDALGDLPEGTYYIADLEGLSVRTADGRTLGVIDEVIKTGSNDVYVLKDTDTQKPILIPVIDDVVKEVNITDGYVLVELLKGLID